MYSKKAETSTAPNSNQQFTSRHPVHTDIFYSQTANLHEPLQKASVAALHNAQSPPHGGPLEDGFTELSTHSWSHQAAIEVVEIISSSLKRVVREPQAPQFLEHLIDVVRARTEPTPNDMARSMLQHMGAIVRTHPNISSVSRRILQSTLDELQTLKQSRRSSSLDRLTEQISNLSLSEHQSPGRQ
ncbi:hypothetical protein N7468_009357 [Penicillium chermesinum]|uniref:Uncharacterized protein n=1 Tax=Penicillium chermesinum TaxID=63820 RepID=A0A9W9NI09_9EURO|nr:uncharacterized protein N7468_009357 [Penicillium chermesinum]KAJ5220153.1 hypothetical protein N7468_009357 [Penicillium chermesinum]